MAFRVDVERHRIASELPLQLATGGRAGRQRRDCFLQVAQALSARDPLAAHVRDELGLEDDRRARPLQAAGSSALAFSSGAILPLLAAVIAGGSLRTPATVGVTLLALAGLGFTGARIGGARELRATVRVTVWGAIAMAVTYGMAPRSARSSDRLSSRRAMQPKRILIGRGGGKGRTAEMRSRPVRAWRAITIRAALVAGCALAVAACGAQSTGTGTGTGTRAASRAAHASARRTLVPPGTTMTATVPSTTTNAAAQDWPEFGYNPQRSNAGPVTTGITAANVGSLRMRTVTLDGIADSSAIALNGVVVRGARRDVVIVTTSYGNTIAIDPSTGAKLWEFQAPGVDRTPGNPQVTTASPVADPDLRSLYAAAPNGVIYKLSLATGRPLWSRSITFDPVHEKIASALNVDGPDVVAVTGGYDGDIPPYDGHVVTITRSTGRIVHVWNSECSNRHRLIRASSCPVTNTHGDNAMWGRAGAVIEPGSGRILTATGNGPFDGHTSWGDSVLELTPSASRLLNWTPVNQAQLDAGDVDLGSASPAILPGFGGKRLAVQGGKDGKLHLLDLARLDGTTRGPGPRLGGQLSETSTPGGGELLTAPAVWSHGGRTYVFAADDSGTAAYRLVDAVHPHLVTVWSDSSAGTSPVWAGGLLYVYDETTGALDVRRPLTGGLLHSFPVPEGHWNSPIVSDGRVLLPTGDYHNSARTSALEILHLPARG